MNVVLLYGLAALAKSLSELFLLRFTDLLFFGSWNESLEYPAAALFRDFVSVPVKSDQL
jgi:hypothetical protein